MNNYDLLVVERDLTEKEYKQLYYNIFREETCNIKWIVPEIYEFIDKVRIKFKYMSKSGKGNIHWCRQNFKYSRILIPRIENGEELYKILGIPIFEESIYDRLVVSGKIGSNSHLVFDKVWNKINIDRIKSFSYFEDISKYIYSKCILFIPNIEIANSVYEFLFKQYSDYEAYRIMEIINEYGITNGVNKYIKPAYRELKVENKNAGKAGVVDVIYRLLDDSYSITDYKTGNPKYYYDHYSKNGYLIPTNKWAKIGIEREITEYFSLLQNGAYKVLNEEEMIPLEHMNIRYGRILYVRDWIGTYNYVKITPEMIVESKKVDEIIEKCINDGYFPKRITQWCPINCDYYILCKKSFDFKKKYKDLDKKVDEVFNYFRD